MQERGEQGDDLVVDTQGDDAWPNMDRDTSRIVPAELPRPEASDESAIEEDQPVVLDSTPVEEVPTSEGDEVAVDEPEPVTESEDEPDAEPEPELSAATEPAPELESSADEDSPQTLLVESDQAPTADSEPADSDPAEVESPEIESPEAESAEIEPDLPEPIDEPASAAEPKPEQGVESEDQTSVMPAIVPAEPEPELTLEARDDAVPPLSDQAAASEESIAEPASDVEVVPEEVLELSAEEFPDEDQPPEDEPTEQLREVERGPGGTALFEPLADDQAERVDIGDYPWPTAIVEDEPVVDAPVAADVRVAAGPIEWPVEASAEAPQAEPVDESPIDQPTRPTEPIDVPSQWPAGQLSGLPVADPPDARIPEPLTQFVRPVPSLDQTQIIQPIGSMSAPDADVTQFLPRVDQYAVNKPAQPTRWPNTADSTQVIAVVPEPLDELADEEDEPVSEDQLTSQSIELPRHPQADPASRRIGSEEQLARRPAGRRRKRRRSLVIAGIVTVVLATGVGVLVASPKAASALGLVSAADATTAPPPPIDASPALRPADGPAPSATGVRGVLGPQAANTILASFSGSVLDASTGNVLWDHNSAAPQTPASTNKLLTSAAALLSLDPQATLDTTVVAGTTPGTVVLVGGGDPTLSSLSAPKQSVYFGAARLDDLVAQVKSHASGPITHVVLDLGRYVGPSAAPGWDPGDVAGGNFAPMVPAMLDGGRQDPTNPDSPRSANPARDLGVALAQRLGVNPAAVVPGQAPAGAEVLGAVHSAPVQDLVANLLQISDNVLAEALGREVARVDGQPESFAGSTTAIADVLRRNGFDTSGMSTVDASGLSVQDRVSAGLLASVLRVAAAPNGADPRTARLRPLLDGLPVGGGSGTLSNRFTSGSSVAGKGWVRAKTGTVTSAGANALAGVVLDSDDHLLVFALMSSGSPPGAYAGVETALDTMAATLRNCGCR